MTTADYDKVSSDLLTLASTIETAKRPGYTGGSTDVLANFKNVAARAGISAEQAWATYFLKHIDAIVSIMTKPDLPVSEEPPGRFADAVNYLKLGFALLQEREKPAGELLMQGRFFCETCQITRVCVRPVSVVEVNCPWCGAVCVSGCGDD